MERENTCQYVREKNPLGLKRKELVVIGEESMAPLNFRIKLPGNEDIRKIKTIYSILNHTLSIACTK